MDDVTFIRNLRKYGVDPTLFDMQHVFKLIRDGDLRHVDEPPASVTALPVVYDGMVQR